MMPKRYRFLIEGELKLLKPWDLLDKKPWDFFMTSRFIKVVETI